MSPVEVRVKSVDLVNQSLQVLNLFIGGYDNKRLHWKDCLGKSVREDCGPFGMIG